MFSNEIAGNTSSGDISSNVLDSMITGISYDKMKSIVKGFFLGIDPSFKDRLDYIFNLVTVITNKDGRSVATDKSINFYYKDTLGSLITLAHEVSHYLAKLNDSNEIDVKNKIGTFSEVESTFTEQVFMDYLMNNGLMIVDQNSKQERSLNITDIKIILSIININRL